MKIELELTDHYRLDFYPAALRRAAQHLGDSANPNEYAVVMEVAEQIEAHLPKPRIPEPSKWGVVEAHHDGNAMRRRYVHTDPDEWVCVESGYFYSWPDLIDPVLIREGI